MRDRWDEDEEELGRGRGRTARREPEPEREPTLSELIDNSVRRLVTGLVIAGGLIALGTWGAGRGGGGSAPDYQIATSADGRIVYRITTDTGRIIACEGTHCWQMLARHQDLDESPPAETPKQNVTAPPQPQAVTTQPAPAQLPAPQNSAAPAAR